MRMIFSINKTNPPKKQNKNNNIKPQVIDSEPIVPESFNFFKKTAMFKQILLPYNCGSCGK
jgi:hypothetical protein